MERSAGERVAPNQVGAPPEDLEQEGNIIAHCLFLDERLFQAQTHILRTGANPFNDLTHGANASANSDPDPEFQVPPLRVGRIFSALLGEDSPIEGHHDSLPKGYQR